MIKIDVAKIGDVVRQTFKDKKDFIINQQEIELLASQINVIIDEKIQRLEMDKERSSLENEKLKLELQELKNKSLISTEKTTFFAKDFVALNGHNGDYSLVTIHGSFRVTKNTALEIQEKLNKVFKQE